MQAATYPVRHRFALSLGAGYWLLAGLLLVTLSARAQRRELAPGTTAPRLGQAWLWLDAEAGRLRPYIPGVSPAVRVLYHQLPLSSEEKAGRQVRLRARAGQCVLIDNQLVFSAPASGTYALDLTPYLHRARPLLAIWHPTADPDLGIFLSSAPAGVSPQPAVTSARPRIHPPPDSARNVFIIVLALVGILYGSLRAAFGISLSHFLRLELATRQGGEVRLAVGALPSTSLTALFGLGFALSFALLLVVVQTNFERTGLLRYLFPPSDSDVLLRIGLYTIIVIAFVVLRYIFLAIVGYVFDLTALVGMQYAAFVRTLLLAGAYVPPTILLHLVLAEDSPVLASRISNLLLVLLLVAVVVRSVLALRGRYSLINPHLFAYLCATEVIPLLVLFRLIVSPLF